MGEQRRGPMVSISSVKVETELGQLGLKNQQGKRIDEAAQHPLGNKAHLIGKTQIPPKNLQQTRHQPSHHQVLDTQACPPGFTGGHKTCHQQGSGAGG